jgi:hypothetical protein
MAWRKQDLQRATVCVHFWPRGRTPMVETKKASEKSAGRGQRLQDFGCMCLPIPAIQNLEEFNQGGDVGIVEGVGENRVGVSGRG